MSRGRWLVAIGLMAVIAVAIGASWRESEPTTTIEIDIRYSHYSPQVLTVPAGVPIRFVFVNNDPIDHEWIVGDDGVHERHRNGTEASHGARPTEQSIPAGGRVQTVVTFSEPGTLLYICHLPGHEAYGMVGTLHVTGGG
jgi:uncharacterized cupredoxin-like copper-binding protein